MTKVVHKYPAGHEIVTFTSQWTCEEGHANDASLMDIEASEECGKARIGGMGVEGLHHCLTCGVPPTHADLESMLQDIFRQVVRDRNPGAVVYWRR